jgi:hypothetical protein
MTIGLEDLPDSESFKQAVPQEVIYKYTTLKKIINKLICLRVVSGRRMVECSETYHSRHPRAQAHVWPSMMRFRPRNASSA